MCGRYTIKDPVALAQLIAHLTGEPFAIVAARYNICPSQSNPVVRPRPEGKPAATAMRWGLVPRWLQAPTAADGHANARSEDMFERRSFSEAVQLRRGVAGADGFYEWRRLNKRDRIPHHFCLKSRVPFFFGALFEEGVDRPPTYALLTTGPNALMALIHDRMPVILTGDALARWLTPGPISPEEARQICRPFDAGQMEAWQVSTLVNRPAQDSPDCVAPASGLPPVDPQGELFS